MFSSLKNDGLVYADTLLASPRNDLNGCRLAVFRASGAAGGYRPADCDGENLISYLGSLAVKGWGERHIPELGGDFFEVTASAGMQGYSVICYGRMLFSKQAVLKPLEDLLLSIQGSVAAAVLLVIITGFFVTGRITGPLNLLTEGAKKISEGEFSHVVPHSGADEIGTLASAFNEMSGMVTRKISELEDLNRELTRLDRLKDEFLANTSHELKTPLNGIIGIAELLRERAGTVSSAETAADLSIIAESGRRLETLVNDILDHARLRNSDLALNIKPVGLRPSVAHVLALCSHQAQKKGITLDNNVPAAMPMILADEDRLQQILFNIVGNAVKFTGTGGVTVSAEERPGKVVIIVTDTGIGMEQSQLQKIFDPFYQADGSASRSYSGVGLGLSVTRQLVDLHSGIIEVFSEPGSGSEFRIILPSAGKKFRDEADPVPAVTGPTGDSGNYIRPAHLTDGEPSAGLPLVLIVDDEEVNLHVAANTLLLEGFRVETAAGGFEALKFIEDNGPPDLVLLDVMMPGMTGYEVCAKLREKHKPFELPVIMLTAKTREEDILLGFEAGANDYISKPVNRGVLAARVRSFIALKKAVDQHQRFVLLEEELNIATAIQRSILPPSMAGKGPVRLSAVYKPAGMVGGDFYDYSLSADDSLTLVIADVTGHGVPAALIASMMKIAFAQNLKMAENPDIVMESINKALFSSHSGQIITAQIIHLDLITGRLILSNAGHWPTLLLKKGTDEIKEIHCRGIPLCMIPDVEYGRVEVPVDKGDRIVLYTDGIIEAADAEGAMFGEERFRKKIIELRDLKGEMFVNRISTIVDDWSALNLDPDYKDDYCVICVDIV
jgi:signal transduction histidine kinase/serine phosphatase RsbU (regulator of sigma subunit)